MSQSFALASLSTFDNWVHRTLEQNIPPLYIFKHNQRNAYCFDKPGKKNLAFDQDGFWGSIKLTAAYGDHVTALSRSESKREKALGVGAKAFEPCLGNPDKMKELYGKFDVIIDTCPANTGISNHMDMLKFNGTYCRVGIPETSNQSFSYEFIPLIFSEKKIVGSVVTRMKRMRDMLELVATNMETLGTVPNDWGTKTVLFAQINETLH